MAQSTRSLCWRIYVHVQLSAAGDLRSVAADEAGCGLDPANLAEGFRRRGKAGKVGFLNIAEGSIEECRYFLILSQDLGYGETAQLTARIEEISKMLNAYNAAILASDS